MNPNYHVAIPPQRAAEYIKDIIPAIKLDQNEHLNNNGVFLYVIIYWKAIT